MAESEGDQDLAAFLDWLKERGYSEEIIQVYAYDGTKPVVREKWNKYFAMREEEMPYRELETMPIVFVDLIATDEEASNEPLQGQTDTLEDYLSRIYGKSFEIHYQPEKVSYASVFGKPILQSNAKGQEWLKFNPGALNTFARETAKRITQERQLPPNAVMIHWAAKQWEHPKGVLKIQDHTGSSPAVSGMGFTGYGLGIYAHEWGHGLGLGHMFVSAPGSRSRQIWGLECIMNHSYIGYANMEVGRLLSPLGRYVLEPQDGFLDQKTYVATYNETMAGTQQLERRLQETRTAATVASRMAWTTPWSTRSTDSVIRPGLDNGSYAIHDLERHSGMQPGRYVLLVGTSGRSDAPTSLILQQDGQVIASAPFSWRTKVSPTTPHEITIEDYLTLSVAASSGSKNLYGIGKLIHGKPLVVDNGVE